MPITTVTTVRASPNSGGGKPQRRRRNRNGNGSKQVTLSEKDYSRLISRPKPSTLRKDCGGMGRGMGRGNPYLRTLLDPVRVTGVKVPDVTSYPTGTFQLYDRFEVAMIANQQWAMAWQPNLTAWNCYTPNLGTTAFGSWSAHNQYSMLSQLYHAVRPVSACLRFSSISSSTNNAGEIAFCLVDPAQTLSAMNSFDTVAKRFGAYRRPLKESTEFLWMPLDPQSRTFLLPSTGSSTGVINSYWPGIVIAVAGAAASQPIVVEMFCNYEAVPEFSTFDLVNASAPYVSNSALEEATATVTQIGSFGRQLGEDIGSWMLDQGVQVAGELGRAAAGGAIHYVSNVIRSRAGGHSARLLDLD